MFYLTASCCAVAFLAALFFIDQLELNRADDADLKRQAKEELKKRKMAKKGDQDVEAGCLLGDSGPSACIDVVLVFEHRLEHGG